MIEVLLSGPGLPFAVALLVMFGLLLVELLALLSGVGVNDAIDHHVVAHLGIESVGDAPTGMEATGPADAHTTLGKMLAWFYVGRVPVLMLLIVFLTLFGLTGLILQTLLLRTLDGMLPAMLAVPLVFVLSLPLLRFSAALLVRVIPRDESSAVHSIELIGYTAHVVGGDARPDLPAQARVRDRFGTDHYVLVVPEDQDMVLPLHSEVLLVRKLGGGRFTAIPGTHPALRD